METSIARRVAALMMGSLAAFYLAAPAACATTANWTSSDLDVWFYTNASSAGSRALGPTFLGGVEVNETTQQFEQHSALDPARLGTTLVAFNTGSQITPGLAANRYQINSVKLTATWTYDFDPHTLYYQDTAISQAQVLAEYVSGNVSSQRPMELYGVGFSPSYTGYEFGGGTPGPPLVDELTHPYNAGGYIAYPAVGSSSQAGAYVDVTNSVTGGYSRTALGNSTGPFTPTPWAIGKTNLAVGAALPDNTTFTFELSLAEPGVNSYVQQSLASGAVGFFLSSLHTTGEFGAGGGYPRWYTKEAAGFPYFIPAAWQPQLLIDYTILPPGVPGDYNGNGTVDGADYVLWRKGGPLANEMHNVGIVNEQDYLEWRARFGNTSASGGSLGGGTGVPEPQAVLSLWIVAAMSRNWPRRKKKGLG